MSVQNRIKSIWFIVAVTKKGKVIKAIVNSCSLLLFSPEELNKSTQCNQSKILSFRKIKI